MRRLLALPLMAMLAGAGCASRETRPAAVVRDSAGVAIVENSAPADPGEPRLLVDSIPAVDIGGGEDPNTDFGSDHQAARFADGRIVVASRSNHDLRFFDDAGRWIRTVGRQGGGPGEFDQPTLVGIGPGDSILVFDYGSRRLSVFDSAGRFARAVTWIDSGAKGTASDPSAVFPDGKLLIRTGRFVTPQDKSGIRRDTVPLSLGGADGKVEGLIGAFPGGEAVVEATGQTVTVSRLLFGRDLHAAVMDSLVIVGTGDRFSFDLYRRNGTLVRRVRRSYAEMPVTDQDVAASIEQQLAGFPQDMEQMKPRFRKMWETAPRPSTKPPYDLLLVTRTGQIWIREFNQPNERTQMGRYAVFDRSGQWLETGLLPAGVVPVDVDAKSVLATWLDHDDVAHIRVYRLRVRER